MESSAQISILARQFDDLCKGFNNLIEDFRRYAVNQENCQIKWLEAEDEVRHLKNQLNDANQVNSKLQAQYHQTTVLLKNEVKVRTHLQEEKKTLEKKLKSSKERTGTAENNAEPPRRNRHSMPGMCPPSRDWLCNENVSDSNSMGTSSIASEIINEETNRDSELPPSSARSSRISTRSNRPSGFDSYLTTDGGFKRRSRRDGVLDTSCSERLIATTTVSIPIKGGPITATSVIETSPETCEMTEEINSSFGKKRRVRIDSHQQLENEPDIAPSAPSQSLLEPPKNRFIMSETSPTVNGRRSTSVPATARLSEGQGAAYLRPVASGGRLSLNQRRHNFSQKTIIKSENCLPCGNRIKFGKLAFKCSDCRATCHVDCKTRMPQICVPTTQASISRGLAGTLADFAPSTVPMIPSLIVHCVNEVERRGMKEVALYRVNGSEKEITDLKEEMVRGKMQPQRLAQVNIHVVTGALKLFLRTLKEPLITFTLWKSFAGICDLDEEMDVQTALYALIPELPRPNRDTLAYLILHIQKVADTPECKMLASSLARVFGPIIIGHSRPNPDVELTLKETKKQACITEKLLQIPSDYWCRFIMTDH
ncbi:rac GTPase-activating protein 1-like isoform X1 [Daphnia pulex]|uniref:rac GTPase-activating protein 1-like isoform X1 n=1 Tax=Daphnia pulex TaxID=6669 RepID=UPI001EDCA0A2|nr:rac GTPase-activating protein 1-like isoform X1 [Daphnia pulex]